jgi:hypothetical protein
MTLKKMTVCCCLNSVIIMSRKFTVTQLPYGGELVELWSRFGGG